MNQPRIGLLLVQLGTPERPDTQAVREYLGEFLADPRVVDAPRWWWLPLLHGVILRTRPARSAALYRRIWRPDGVAPLRHFTERQAALLSAHLGPAVRISWAMRYGKPAIREQVTELLKQGVDRLLVFPLFPQFSASTTGSVLDAVYAALAPRRFMPALRIAAPFYDDPGMIHVLTGLIRARVTDPATFFLFSFHGLPERYIREGDPYADQCAGTARLLATALGLTAGQWRLSYQSRFGREPWLTPATFDLLAELPGQGVRQVAVLCPGFVADCLETLDEIGREGARHFLAAGGAGFTYIPCLNDTPTWIAALAARIQGELAGWLNPTDSAMT